MGFSVPIDAWLRDPLRDWAEHLLSVDRLEREGFFNPRAIRDIWMNHLIGQRSLGSLLWPILMFQAWLDEWFK
jgi:asparagine synthase (glutamine-hydrolysing)